MRCSAPFAVLGEQASAQEQRVFVRPRDYSQALRNSATLTIVAWEMGTWEMATAPVVAVALTVAAAQVVVAEQAVAVVVQVVAVVAIVEFVPTAIPRATHRAIATYFLMVAAIRATDFVSVAFAAAEPVAGPELAAEAAAVGPAAVVFAREMAAKESS